ncbi:hypothetical protein B0F90DRAFT_1408282 [Multifurca ochricompacta]|uniref:Uncharacterized protein n=1 Tax=Multifurca ochricompacta TaxID=376703 RepID=A0AAD4QIT7_9AGAM|nr:hypothetical protein B0F90DRAFT_1408282 [Multifurca ochricompacta]
MVCKIYPLGPGEQDALNKFLEEHLQKGDGPVETGHMGGLNRYISLLIVMLF